MKAEKLKRSSKKGFSLMEMLMVVAILVILVVVSVPVFTKQLDDVKAVADDANLQAAKQVAITQYSLEKCSFSNIMYYDIKTGSYVSIEPEPYGKTAEHSSMTISAIINETGDGIIVQWE